MKNLLFAFISNCAVEIQMLFINTFKSKLTKQHIQ